MSSSFDPYLKWLGIAPKDQPPNHYRLLGIDPFTDDIDVIANAADRQMAHVRTFQSGQHSQHSQRLLNEIAAAKACLLNDERKISYDNALRDTLKPRDAIAVAKPLPEAGSQRAKSSNSSATPSGASDVIPVQIVQSESKTDDPSLHAT
jgi:hypothetical protein